MGKMFVQRGSDNPGAGAEWSPTMKIRVYLNGTQVNPYHKLGLKCNPFPQIARYEYRAADWALAHLSAEPIPNVEHIKKVLTEAGASKEFIELCCAKFVSGKRVGFEIEFPEKP
jgi:hypothetical protein